MEKELEELSLHDLSEIYQKSIEFLDFLDKEHKKSSDMLETLKK